MEEIVEKLLNCKILSIKVVQELWKGYGCIYRITTENKPEESIIVKYISPPNNSGDAHVQKIESFHIEDRFYRKYAAEMTLCRTPKLIASDFSVNNKFVMVMEDLDSAGYMERKLNRELVFRFILIF